MAITVKYYALGPDGVPTTEEPHVSTYSDPLRAAQDMTSVETYDNLIPAGWEADTPAERAAVLVIRKGRNY